MTLYDEDLSEEQQIKIKRALSIADEAKIDPEVLALFAPKVLGEIEKGPIDPLELMEPEPTDV